jgi:hypothetical protein
MAPVYRVVVGSPSDVAKERRAARAAIYSWDDHNAERLGAFLLPRLWETHATPQMGSPQAVVNREIIDNGHILICMFWSRIGTPTGEAESGTIEEIERFARDDKPVMIYFCTKRFPQDVDLEQVARLRAFKEQIRRRALVDEFGSSAELVAKLQRHLTSTVERLVPPARD